MDLEGNDLARLITSLEAEVHEAAKDLRSEDAARLCGEVDAVRRELTEVAESR